MKLLTASLCLVSLGILSGCVDGPGYRGSPAARDQSCGMGQDDVSHPYAGRCDWRRENGRDWANSGSSDSDSVYVRGR
ncbi:hypothetical protein GGQ73_000694 [Rhizobium skierniewicense]|uniref:Lipoprotein n=1 Tax=Rhizobium skierniewicense TaxID=984260 RepID=A0A7W6C5D9_9HYPH|nr:hypothetical protein [Rhizobium skierniewicense]